jgi:hypothetical protein
MCSGDELGRIDDRLVSARRRQSFTPEADIQIHVS